MPIDHRAVTREICRRSFYEFFKRAWHVLEPNRKYVDNWHVKYLCDVAQSEVERIAEGKKKDHDYIVNMPFRSLKSMIFSVMLHPWTWIDHPWMRFTTTSYSYPLASNHSNKSQKLIDSHWYQSHFGKSFNLRSHIKGKSKLKETEGYYENDQGGFRFVSSLSGGSTGYGGDINIGDDLLKAQDAESEAKRKTSNQFWHESYKSRVSDFDMSVFMLIMQRLHDDDPAGSSLQRMKEAGDNRYFWINLPAENIGNIHPKGLQVYYKNGLFFPERFGRDVLADLQSATGIGRKAYDAQVNQQPMEAGGNLWKKHWFNRIDRSELPKRRLFQKICRYWDTAFTEDEKNSACAYVELGLLDGNVYLLDFGFRWVEFVEQVKWMSAYDGYSKVEAKASGKSSVQVLKKMGMKAEEVEITGDDKWTRGNQIAPHVENGKVFIPDWLWTSFLEDDRQGILKFPEGSHDDVADAFVIGITDLLGRATHLDRDQLDKIFGKQEPTHVYNG